MRAPLRIQTRGRVTLVAAVTLVLPCVGRAEPEPVHVDYAAPAGCPDATAFLGALRARTTRFRATTADEPGRRFRVRVLASGLAFSGALEIRGLDGSTSVRSVDATVCDEVANALALMTALAIDPDALTSKPPSVAEGPTELPADPTTEPAAAPPETADAATMRLMWPPPATRAPAPRPPSATRAPAPRPPSPPPSATRAPAPRPPSPPWRWSAGLHGHLTFLLAPSLGYGSDVFVDAEAPPSSALGPALRLGVFLNRSDVDLVSGAGARFQWAAAGLEGCPARLAVLAGRVALHPCLALHLGGLHGEGRRIKQPRRTWSLWSDAGLVLRLRIAATEHLLVEAQGQLLLPLHRPRFDITDDFTPRQAYSVPHLGVVAGMGAAYRFR